MGVLTALRAAVETTASNVLIANKAALVRGQSQKALRVREALGSGRLPLVLCACYNHLTVALATRVSRARIDKDYLK